MWVEKRKCDLCFGVNNVTCPHLLCTAPAYQPTLCYEPTEASGLAEAFDPCVAKGLRCLKFLDAKSYHPVFETSKHVVLSEGNCWQQAQVLLLQLGTNRNMI